MERKYFQDIGYKPFLFYVVFGISGDELEVSQKKHHVDELPKNLDIRTLSREENGEYIDGVFFSGAMGDVLENSNPELYGRCKSSLECVIIRGEIENDSTFDYMRNVIGIIEAFIDKGAVGILDHQTIALYSPEEWTERFFEEEVNAQNHVMIMCSEEENGEYWLHTRGMAEFGRPDIGINNVSEEKLDDYEQIINQMIYYGGQGVFFEEDTRLHTADDKSFVIHPEFVNDFENEDYNNAYYNVTVIEG